MKHSWLKDLVAGITVGVVALPLALGFGVASGAGAAAGLVTAIVAGIVAAVFGGSHLQVSGPTGAMTVVLLPVIAKYGLGVIPLLAIMGGIIVVAMAITAVGRSVEFIPFPVVEGFTMGIGVIIALQQLPLILDAPRGTSESTLVAGWQTIQQADWSHAWQPLAVAVAVIALHLVGLRYVPKWPLALISIIIATVAVVLMPITVDSIGALPTGLPSPRVPDFTMGMLQDLAGPALAIAALAALESLLSARVADGMRPDLSPTNPDRELMGQGLANIASGLFGGLPATGAIARTAVNVRSGARTRLSSVTHAVMLLAVMLLLAPIVATVPMAALGGVLLVTAGRMINLRLGRTMLTVTRADRNTFLLTFAATVLLDLVAAVLLGLLMAAVMSLRHMATYSVVARQNLPTTTMEGVVDWNAEQEHLRDAVAIFRVDGALFYGNAQRFIDEVNDLGDRTAAVIIRCHQMRILDASGAVALDTALRRLRRRHVIYVIQGMNNSQRRTSVLMGATQQRHHVKELSEALTWIDDELRTGVVQTKMI
ncbi:SulP family inorganic anion transporter [Tessaracoccus sp. ZS01]|uniref:SulP family inorganic anion transporter n=1 Tax=Tessaracoccus sp. ZS01 TaxID=1906324 RepID=UPI00130128CA|nr:SulP family inorganic anion transporter [Tessaracoccus sp. ZS01]